MAGNQGDPHAIFDLSRATTPILTQIEPPEEDEKSDGDYGGNQFYDSDRTGQTMNYTAYYNAPGRTSTIFAPLDEAGYDLGNIISQTSTGYQSGIPSATASLWEDGGPLSSGGLKRKSDSISEAASMGDATDASLSNKKSKTTTTSGHANANTPQGRLYENSAGPDWGQTSDPFGSAKSQLLRTLKAKFFELTTPLTNFVTRYLVETGSYSEQALHNSIRIRQLFNRAQEIGDWDKIINTLYGDHLDGWGASGLSDGDPNDMNYLSGSLLHMARLSHQLESDGSTREIQQTLDHLHSLFAKNRRIANLSTFLLNSFNTMMQGKVVFLMDPQIREIAQSTLDLINAHFRKRRRKEPFALIEVMRSSDVMTEFIKFMQIRKQADGLFGVNVISPPPFGGGLYGTMGDRITAGSRAYQQSTYGGGGDRVTQIFSRPTTTNTVAISQQFWARFLYFGHVEKARDGSGGLEYVDPQEQRTRHQYWTDLRESNNPDVVFDPVTSTYRRVLAPDPTSPEQAILRPIESLSDAIKICNAQPSMRVTVAQGEHKHVNPYVLSYKDARGDTQLLSRRILLDQAAMDRLYLTQDPGSYKMSL